MPVGETVIAVILPRGMEYSNRLLEGAIQYANEHRYLRIVDVPFSPGGDSPLRGTSPGFDGALTRLSPDDGWALELLSLDVAVVNTNSNWRDEVPFVAFSHEAVVETVVDYLAGMQVTEFAYVGFERRGEPGFQRRWSLIQKATRQRSLPARLVEIEDRAETSLAAGELQPVFPLESRQCLRRSLSELGVPVGVWCEDDYVGFLVCEQVRELGLRIPGDVAVLGLGNYRIARCCNPPLSSIPQPGQIVGYEAMRLLDGILDGSISSPSSIALPPPAIICRESTSSGKTTVGYLQRARRIIAEHACEGITVTEAARMAGVSPQALTDRFRDVVGHTPGAEIRRVRLDHAKRYLLTTDLSIAQIAGLCGYNQQTKFGKFFKRQTGVAPSRFRRRKGDAA